MIGVATIAGVTMLGVAGSKFATRHRDSIRQAVFHENDKEYALSQLLRVTRLPSFRWEQNRQALSLILAASLSIDQSRDKEAQDICDRLLEMDINPSLKGLIFACQAKLNPEDARSYRAQFEELWTVGRPDLEKLGLSECLSYCLYGLGEFDKAAELFDELVKTDPTPVNLLYRLLSHSMGGSNSDTCIEKANDLLQNPGKALYKAIALGSISASHHFERRHEEAYAAVKDCLRACLREKARKALASDEHPWEALGVTNCIAHAEALIQRALHRGIYDARALGSFDEARSIRKEWLLRRDSRDYFPLVIILTHEGNHERALLELEKHDLPTDELDTLAFLHLRHGEPEKALNTLGECSEHREKLALTYLDLLRGTDALAAVDSAGDVEWANLLRSYINHIWFGRPNSDRSCPTGAHYRGDFETALKLRLDHRDQQFPSLDRGYRRANLAYQTALFHHLKKELEDALPLYREAEELYAQSPLNRDQCRINITRCELALQKIGEPEFRDHADEMRGRYPSNPSILRELELTEVLLHSYAENHPETIRLSTLLLEKEARHFEKARILGWRAKAYLAIENETDATKDFRTMVELVPESYLAKEALDYLS